MTSFVACIGGAGGMNQKLEEGTQFRMSEVWNRDGGNPLVIMVCHMQNFAVEYVWLFMLDLKHEIMVGKWFDWYCQVTIIEACSYILLQCCTS